MNDNNVGWDIPFDLEQVSDSHDLTLEQCLEAGHEGVFISNDRYHSITGISGSQLSILAISNRHLDNAKLFNLGNTPALTFGSLLHTMVLEPEQVDNRYAVLPKFATKAETGLSIVQSNRQFHQDNQNRIIVDEADMRKAQRMAVNVRAIAGDIIDSGIKERSLFADLDGIICKCRLDIETQEGNDLDLKSFTPKSHDLSDAALERHIKNLNYHLSAGFRNIVRRSLGLPVRDSFLIFCSTSPGHMVKIIQIAPEWIEEAELQVLEMLEDRRFYLASKIDKKPPVIDDRSR